MRFPYLRLILLTLAFLSQAYLYVRIQRTIRSSQQPQACQRRMTRLVGVTFCLLFAVNTYIVSRPIPWVDPPVAIQMGLCYLVAVWNFGSLFSGLGKRAAG